MEGAVVMDLGRRVENGRYFDLREKSRKVQLVCIET